MTHNIEFLQRRIEEQKALREAARNDGDYKRFEFHERELLNLETLLKNLGVEND